VGSYLFAGNGNATTANPGNTIAGGSLRYGCMYNGTNAGEAGWKDPGGGTPTGTWQLMGQTGQGINNTGVYFSVNQRNTSISLFQRIS
jgi:hypothetical protein